MNHPKPNPVFRLMPSLTDIALLIPMLFLFTRMDGVRSMLGDGDTGWHIRTGEWILAHHAVPRVDMFSFTRPGEPWFAWEWLWDAGAAWLYRYWGLGGVVLASMLVLSATFMLLYRLVYRRSGNGIVAILVTALAAAGSAIHWLARPHLLTWLFMVIFLSLIERVREGRARLLWWLPALTIVWTNLHGGFLAGIVILGAYTGGELLRALFATGREERMSALRAAVPYGLTAAGCLAASLVNPYFYHLHAHILSYLQDPYEIKHIVEFQSANFRNAGVEFFEAMLVVGLGAAIWSAGRKNFADVLLLAGWGHLGLLSARNIPLFMLVAAPVAATAIVAWTELVRRAALPAWMAKTAETVQAMGEEVAPFERIGRAHAICAAVFIVIGFGMAAPSAGKMLKPEYDPKAYPSRALAYLKEPGQRIFADDEWGDYLVYNLSPLGIKVYIDGRSDFYGQKFCEEYIQLMGVKYDWEQTLARYRINTVLLAPNEALASTMKESSHWRVIYDDGSAIVFRSVRPAGYEFSTGMRGGTASDLAITQIDTKKGGTP